MDLRADTAWHTPGKTAPAGAEPAAGRLSRSAGCTSHATGRRLCAPSLRACAWGSIHPGSAPGIQDAGTVGAASRPWAITSRQNKKPAPTRPAIAVHVAQALWHRHWLIFTMDSLPQSLQYTTSSVVRVVGRSFFTRPLPHTGQMSHPSFAISVAPLASIGNTISSLSCKCPQKPTRLQVLKSYSKYKAPFFLGSIQE